MEKWSLCLYITQGLFIHRATDMRQRSRATHMSFQHKQKPPRHAQPPSEIALVCSELSGRVVISEFRHFIRQSSQEERPEEKCH